MTETEKPILLSSEKTRPIRQKRKFYILQSSNNQLREEQFGSTGDIPVAGDWDGDGKPMSAFIALERNSSKSAGLFLLSSVFTA
jgi:hypothetical protein